MFASLVGVGGFILKPGEEPPQAYCRQEGHPVVPDVFHKLWSGVRCPPVQDLVSLLSTVLLLRPARVVYTTTYDTWLCWQVRHQEPMGLYIALHAHKKKRWFDVQSCHRRLGVERRIINTRDNQTAFANATREFAAARPNPPSKLPRSSNTAETGVGKTSAVQMTDILRAYVMLNEGGLYLDGDMFVLSGGEYQTWRRCPTVVGTSRGTWFPPVRANDSETLNTAAMLAAPGLPFMHAFWERISKWNGHTKAQDICCGWPSRYAEQSLAEVGEVVALGQVFPFRLNGSLPQSTREELHGSWADEIERMATDGAAVVHLANWKIRTRSQLPVLRAVLARSVRLRGGRDALSDGERFCLDMAHDWIDFTFECPRNRSRPECA